MRLSLIILLGAVSVMGISGCGTTAANWRSEALLSFDRVVTSGADGIAPEEVDTIRRTMALADRYSRQEMNEDADRLYELSCRKSRLLYRSLINQKVLQGAGIILEDAENRHAEEVTVAREQISLHELLKHGAPSSEPETSTAGQQGGQASDRVAEDHDPQPVMKEPAPPTGGHRKPPGMHAAPGRAGERIEPGRKTIYLTFDDGPSRLTLPIANFLKSQGIAATFFVLGSNIAGRERIVASTLALGHRVGNHTFSHNLRKLSASFDTGKNEVSRTGAMIERLGGDGRMVRIPYGASGRDLVSKVAAEGAQIFDWDINSYDTTRKGVRNHLFIENTVQRQLKRIGKRHVILLFHDGSGHDSTLAAIRDLIPKLKREGYRFGVLAGSEHLAKASIGHSRGL